MNLQEYKEAGKIAGETLVYGKKLIKEGVKIGEVTKKIEDKIFSSKAKPAFPVQLSLNNAAAHCYYTPENEAVFKQGDLVKLDLGVHVKGFIADNACTIDLSGDDNLDLIRASKDALKEALNLMTPGRKIGEIGKAVEEVIVGYGFKPIKNLSGHEVEEFNLHAGMNIPNYDNGNKVELEEGQVFAVEPFASTGAGKVEEGKDSGIYKVMGLKNVRVGREVLKYLYENFRVLPFSKTWIKGFEDFKLNSGFRFLEQQEIIHNYPQLVEAKGEKVSQAEHTVIVGEKPLVITKV
jgi:methionyl aminopeptidase